MFVLSVLEQLSTVIFQCIRNLLFFKITPTNSVRDLALQARATFRRRLQVTEHLMNHSGVLNMVVMVLLCRCVCVLLLCMYVCMYSGASSCIWSSVVLFFPWNAAVGTITAGTPRVKALATGPLIRARLIRI